MAEAMLKDGAEAIFAGNRVVSHISLSTKFALGASRREATRARGRRAARALLRAHLRRRAGSHDRQHRRRDGGRRPLCARFHRGGETRGSWSPAPQPKRSIARLGPDTTVEAKLTVASGGELAWLPRGDHPVRSCAACPQHRGRSRGRRTPAARRGRDLRPFRHGRDHRGRLSARSLAHSPRWSLSFTPRPHGSKAMWPQSSNMPQSPEARFAVASILMVPGDEAAADAARAVSHAMPRRSRRLDLERNVGCAHGGRGRRGAATRHHQHSRVSPPRALAAALAQVREGTGAHELDASRKGQAVDRHGGDGRAPPARARRQAQSSRGGRTHLRFHPRGRARWAQRRRADGSRRRCADALASDAGASPR